jgi:hypothetical protein
MLIIFASKTIMSLNIKYVLYNNRDETLWKTLSMSTPGHLQVGAFIVLKIVC